jgi:hypothetical protein
VACVFNIVSVSVCLPPVACVFKPQKEEKQKHWQY